MLGKGRAEALDDGAFEALAIELACPPQNLEAIAKVESKGFGWFPDGRIKILFEKHWFYKLLKGAKRKQAVAAGLARRKWIAPKRGGYRDQKTPDDRYALLARAMDIDVEAALQSISMGTYQIMGFNHKTCGFSSAAEMWAAFLDSEKHQLRAFANFLKEKGLVRAIQTGKFDQVEEIYNGGGLNGTYAARMEEWAAKLGAGKWADWDPTSVVINHPVEHPPVPNSKPLAKSRTVAGSGIAGVGGASLLVEPVQKVVEVVEGQEAAFSSGDLTAMAIGVVVVAGALFALYARWDDAGRPLPWGEA